MIFAATLHSTQTRRIRKTQSWFVGARGDPSNRDACGSQAHSLGDKLHSARRNLDADIQSAASARSELDNRTNSHASKNATGKMLDPEVATQLHQTTKRELKHMFSQSLRAYSAALKASDLLFTVRGVSRPSDARMLMQSSCSPARSAIASNSCVRP